MLFACFMASNTIHFLLRLSDSASVPFFANVPSVKMPMVVLTSRYWDERYGQARELEKHKQTVAEIGKHTGIASCVCLDHGHQSKR
jgi:hypothetical protein